MQKFNIPARDLPVLRLSFHGSPAGHIEPEDLWIVGTNGRLVLVNRGEHYIIIDRAENFEPPQWHIAPLADRSKGQKLGPDTLRSVL